MKSPINPVYSVRERSNEESVRKTLPEIKITGERLDSTDKKMGSIDGKSKAKEAAQGEVEKVPKVTEISQAASDSSNLKREFQVLKIRKKQTNQRF